MALAAVKYFDSNDFNEMNPSQQFIEMLYHDDHKSFAYRNMKYSNNTMIQTGYMDKSALLSDVGFYDTWISLNLFTSSNSRAASNCRELTGFYFDLDKHDGSVNQIRQAVLKSSALLYDLVDKKILPKPTIVTNTGRGLGIYYVFENTLAITTNTEKQQKLYTYLYSKLADILNSYFADSSLLEVDPVVINDRSRIVRLPGSYNSSARSYCSIQFIGADRFGHVAYYNLSDFKPFIQKYEESCVKEVKQESKVMPVISFTGCTSTFLYNRVSQMCKLQHLFNFECTNKRREYMCFIYYNSAKQIYSNAADMLRDFNRDFLEPLSDSEIAHVIKSVDTSYAASHSGYYKLSDQWIIDKLKLSQEELDATLIGQSQRKLMREAAKEKTKATRLERDMKIVALLKNESLTYEMIAFRSQVSLSTVKRIAKANKINRYNLCKLSANSSNTDISMNSDACEMVLSFMAFVPELYLLSFLLLRLNHNFLYCIKVHFLAQSLYVVLYLVVDTTYIVINLLRGPPYLS